MEIFRYMRGIRFRGGIRFSTHLNSPDYQTIKTPLPTQTYTLSIKSHKLIHPIFWILSKKIPYSFSTFTYSSAHNHSQVKLTLYDCYAQKFRINESWFRQEFYSPNIHDCALWSQQTARGIYSIPYRSNPRLFTVRGWFPNGPSYFRGLFFQHIHFLYNPPQSWRGR